MEKIAKAETAGVETLISEVNEKSLSGDVKGVLVHVHPDGKVVVPTHDADNRPLILQTPDGNTLEPVVKHIQNVIDGPPATQEQLWSQACSNDKITIDSWKDQWIDQLKENAKNFDFAANSVMKVFSKEEYKPMIIAGSGPSLKKNAYALKEREDIRIVSCLHNFSFFEDLGVMGEDDYYLNLDAGEITIKEVSEGGKKSVEEYWEISKNRTLITHVTVQPELLRKWKGRIFFFQTGLRPDLLALVKDLLDYSSIPAFDVGGNALGACMYAAKAILGCGVMIFIGADFAFDRTRKFHAWDSPYDKQFSGLIPCTDIWGDRVYSWQSYFNFKSWFDYMAVGGQGNNQLFMVNATEGGIMGAYAQGNIKQIIQMDLKSALHQFTMHKELPKLMEMSKAQNMPVLLF